MNRRIAASIGVLSVGWALVIARYGKAGIGVLALGSVVGAMWAIDPDGEKRALMAILAACAFASALAATVTVIAGLWLGAQQH